MTPRIAVTSLIAFSVLAASCAGDAPTTPSGGSAPTVRSQEPGPLTVANCGWPMDTVISFQGWATEAELGLMVSSPTNERLYWIITGEPVELMTSQGSADVRAACAVNGEGLHSFRRIADDWQPPSP